MHALKLGEDKMLHKLWAISALCLFEHITNQLKTSSPPLLFLLPTLCQLFFGTKVPHSFDVPAVHHKQAWKLKFRLREHISCFCCTQTSHAALKADSQGSNGINRKWALSTYIWVYKLDNKYWLMFQVLNTQWTHLGAFNDKMSRLSIKTNQKRPNSTFVNMTWWINPPPPSRSILRENTLVIDRRRRRLCVVRSKSGLSFLHRRIK